MRRVQDEVLESAGVKKSELAKKSSLNSSRTSTPTSQKVEASVEAIIQTKPVPVPSAYFPQHNNNKSDGLLLQCKKEKDKCEASSSTLPKFSLKGDKGKEKKDDLTHLPEQFPDPTTSTAAVARKFLNEAKTKGTKFEMKELDEILERIKPPTLPDIEVCSVLPGTPEWQAYWMDFNQKMNTYNDQVERHSRRLDSLLVDDDGFSYKKDLKKRELEEKILKLSMGLPPKPPIIKQPLKETLDIGGYMIRPLGGPIPGTFITTHDHSRFRLEIMVDKIEEDLENITVDPKFNMMTITVPNKEKGTPFKQLIQITVPNYKKVQNLEVGHPLYNGGCIVITGK